MQLHAKRAALSLVLPFVMASAALAGCSDSGQTGLSTQEADGTDSGDEDPFLAAAKTAFQALFDGDESAYRATLRPDQTGGIYFSENFSGFVSHVSGCELDGQFLTETEQGDSTTTKVTIVFSSPCGDDVSNRPNEFCYLFIDDLGSGFYTSGLSGTYCGS